MSIQEDNIESCDSNNLHGNKTVESFETFIAERDYIGAFTLLEVCVPLYRPILIYLNWLYGCLKNKFKSLRL